MARLCGESHFLEQLSFGTLPDFELRISNCEFKRADGASGEGRGIANLELCYSRSVNSGEDREPGSGV
jgi:hypothetical protein